MGGGANRGMTGVANSEIMRAKDRQCGAVCKEWWAAVCPEGQRTGLDGVSDILGWVMGGRV